jgi:hypothetical protein
MQDEVGQGNAHVRYCLDCRYALQGLAENQCPECGRSFNPQDPSTTAFHPVRDSRIVLAKTGKVLAVGMGIVAGAAFVFSSIGIGTFFLVLAGLFLSPLIVVILIVALIPSVPLATRWRVAGIASVALLVSIALTDWPFRIMFALHRPALNRFVARAQSGQLSTNSGSVGVGLFRFVDFRTAPNGNLGFQLTGGGGGGTFLVYTPQQTAWIWYNTNWTQDLGGGWFRVEED